MGAELSLMRSYHISGTFPLNLGPASYREALDLMSYLHVSGAAFSLQPITRPCDERASIEENAAQ